MSSEYDDSIWELVQSEGRAPDPWLAQRARKFAAGSESVLDLGCGDGLFLPELASAGGAVSGADRSTVALGRSAQREPSATLHEVGANERLLIEDNSFERIWCSDTLEHVVDTQVVLSEARRVLVPGGRMLVATPDHPLRLRLRIALRGWESHFDPFSPHLRFYTERSLRDALDGCGFATQSVEKRGGLLIAEALRA
jgi:ubiquinone/menaquinone biosynthesis C-methylase UbiE